MALLKLDEVSVRFAGLDGSDVVAVQQVSATLAEGDFVSIIGPNGSGKSSLFNAIAGAAPLAAGHLWLQGRQMDQLPAHKRARWIGRVFQNPFQGTASELSVADNFRLAFLRTQAKQPWFAAGRKMEMQAKEAIAGLGLGLENKWNQLMGSLSGGQRQTLTVLMATLAPAKLLMLDEPVAALDPNSARTVMETAARLAKEQGLTVLHVTHKLSDALAYGNRLWAMKQGQLVADLPNEEKRLLTQDRLETRFFARR